MKSTFMQFPVLILLLLALTSGAEYKNVNEKRKDDLINRSIEEKLIRVNRYTFAGETLPFYNLEVRKSFRKQLSHVATSGWHSHYLLKESMRVFPTIEKILQANGVPSDIKYIAVCESALDSKSISPQKAVGVWQLMKQTGIELGLEINNEVDERLNLELSTTAACKLLKRDRDFFGSWCEAAVAYNMGSVALYKAQRKQKSKELHELVFNRETKNYLMRALAYKEFMENAPMYGQPFPRTLSEFAYDTVSIHNNIDNLQAFCDKLHWNYQTIKKDNPWILGNKLTIKNKKKAYKLLVRRY